MTPLGCMPLLHVDLFGRRDVVPRGKGLLFHGALLKNKNHVIMDVVFYMKEEEHHD